MFEKDEKKLEKNRQNVAKYRERIQPVIDGAFNENWKRRLDTYLDYRVTNFIELLAEHYSLSKKDLIEKLVVEQCLILEKARKTEFKNLRDNKYYREMLERYNLKDSYKTVSLK